MRIRVFLSTLLSLICFTSESQEIYQVLLLDNVTMLKSDYSSKKMVFKSTKNPKSKIAKTIVYINENNFITGEERFGKKGRLLMRITMDLGYRGTKLAKRKIERWPSKNSYQAKFEEYHYDRFGYLTKITRKYEDGQLDREIILENNVKGDPVKFKSRYGTDPFSKFEMATYNYPRNEVEVTLLTESGQQIASQTYPIDPRLKDHKTNLYNQRGDVTKAPGVEIEYKYDKSGNWTRKRVYHYGDWQRGELKYEITRKISYR